LPVLSSYQLMAWNSDCVLCIYIPPDGFPQIICFYLHVTKKQCHALLSWARKNA